MQIRKIKNRGMLFTAKCDDWDYNLYLIQGKKRNFVIDTGLGSGSVAPILEQIKNDLKETIVINTHYHWDHIWGNGSFGDCMIVSHQLCREMLLSEWETMMQKHGQHRQGEAVLNLPNLVFQEELYFADDRIKLFHTPGHTADSISILDEEDSVLILADNIGDTMEEIIPGLDCERDVYRQTLEKYKQAAFDLCISGHNKVLGKEVICEILNIL